MLRKAQGLFHLSFKWGGNKRFKLITFPSNSRVAIPELHLWSTRFFLENNEDAFI
ncbi:MAG: hypothetical protein QG646_630 [Euryarchaeota archaeon]|nr:hypothetical protein [Euryarchaeota archaeon]